MTPSQCSGSVFIFLIAPGSGLRLFKIKKTLDLPMKIGKVYRKNFILVVKKLYSFFLSRFWWHRTRFLITNLNKSVSVSKKKSGSDTHCPGIILSLQVIYRTYSSVEKSIINNLSTNKNKNKISFAQQIFILKNMYINIFKSFKGPWILNIQARE